MKFDCVERVLHMFFYKYGGFVAKHPLPFLLIPLIIAGALGTGLVFLTTENSIEELYAPENSPAYNARETIDELYQEFGDEDLLPRHLTRLGLYGQVLLRPKKGDDVLTVTVMEEVLRLHSMIMNISVRYSEKNFLFSDLCLMWDDHCDEIAILEAFNYSKEAVGSRTLTFPVAITSDGRSVFIGTDLGKVSLHEENDIDVVTKAKYMQLTYRLRYDDTVEETLGSMWEREFLQQVSLFESDEVTTFRRMSRSLEDDLDESSTGVVLMFSITFTILINFSILSSIMKDSVRSKPNLAQLGVVSAGLAVLSSFGLMSYLGVPYINVVGSAPFLIVGIGVDDMFIMIAAWRKTNVHKSTKERMSESFADAAMSITITSITDALAFGIGAITYFRSVRIFCMYTGVAILFDYAYQITFFAACMALMGYREENNLTAMTCRKVLPEDDSQTKAYCVGCRDGFVPVSQEEKTKRQVEGNDHVTQHAFMLFFKNYFGPFVTHPYAATVTVILYFAYLGIAIWGLLTLDEGLKLQNLSPDYSSVGKYYDLEYQYLREYGPIVSMVVTEEVDYSTLEVQHEVSRVLAELERSDLFHGYEFTKSWLRDFQNYLALNDSRTFRNVSKDAFTDILRTQFLEDPDFRKFIPDVKFDNRTGTIASSRFHSVSKNTNTTIRERDMMIKARDVAQKSSLPMIAYHPAFVYFDQYIEIRPNTLQNLGIALAAMFLVALIMIPHPLCAILVTVSLVSIEVGVVGFMSHWDVALDSISMINLIMCIGFSVDFSAHISYGFISAPGDSSRERAIHALYSLGMPITQSTVSTILAVVVMAWSDSYIFRTFFKTMFLVIGFGALHGLVFLPVFLMLLVPFRAIQGAKGHRDYLSSPDQKDHNQAFDVNKELPETSTDPTKATIILEDAVIV